MSNKKVVLVFVHGWSVSNTDTYGGLPERLQNELKNAGTQAIVKDIFLGRYISFHDEVRLHDISRAFAAAIEDQVAPLIKQGLRFVCITHSTGGPVIRDWWHRYYLRDQASGTCPMSHLIMLAPANYGSALAQLGKGRLSRMKSWFGGVEPGQGVLDWLELGSDRSWRLNKEWIAANESCIGIKGIFPFVLTGQSIDRAFYDNLNTYTGESGSDGVVRVASAHLQGTHVELKQQTPVMKKKKVRKKMVPYWEAPQLELVNRQQAAKTALRVISGKSHSGDDMGIMRSVKKTVKDKKSKETVNAILDCIAVSSKQEYKKIVNQFELETEKVQANEKLETIKKLLLFESHFIHDRYSMVIFKVHDQEGHPVNDYDLLLTAGEKSDPNMLPHGFFVDKQRNSKEPNTITFFFNYDIMTGCDAVVAPDGEVIRKATPGAKKLGFRIEPRPDDGFVHYLPCSRAASSEMLEQVVQPNSTTLVEICLHRVVYKNVMRLDKGPKPKNFKKIEPGDDVVI